MANNGGANSVAVAEHTVAFIVAVNRKLNLQLVSTKAGEWAGTVRQEWLHGAWELSGKTVGIVGAGRIGRGVARRLQGWECALAYTDVVPMPPDEEARLGMTRLPLNELLRTSDVVSLARAPEPADPRHDERRPVRRDEAHRHPHQHLPRPRRR